MPIKPVDTAIIVHVGPLVDQTDGYTLETGIAYDSAGMTVDLFKETDSVITKVDLTLTSSIWTHKGNGIYAINVTAAQNNTEGLLYVVGKCDASSPFISPKYEIVPVDLEVKLSSTAQAALIKDLYLSMRDMFNKYVKTTKATEAA
uniref:Tail protein n=1 Tax=viral metagenome TaxID=1070528 RepID=A0A6M3JZI9_9ZZZZ